MAPIAWSHVIVATRIQTTGANLTALRRATSSSWYPAAIMPASAGTG